MANPNQPVPRPVVAHIGPLATEAEKLAHLQAMKDIEYDTLLKWAQYKARTFNSNVVEGDAHDLLHEALLQGMKDTREWYPYERNFLRFIGGCIRNIAYGWNRRAKYSESADTLISFTDEEAVLILGNTLDSVREELRGHAYSVEIFEMLRTGYCRREIKKILGITDKTYGSAYKWMCRTFAERRSMGVWFSFFISKFDPFWNGENLENELNKKRVEQARAVVQAVIAELQAMSGNVAPKLGEA